MKITPVLLLASLLLALVPQGADAQLFRKREKEQRKLKPGEFEWYPERSKSGPLLIVVSIDDQMAYVYRNAVQIARSTVSTGAPGHDTPTGVFTILQKNKDHESNIYKGAKMPNMQRLTWTGIAMHAGQLPGYPASHGCVRLPLDFSARLFSITEMGGTVVVTKKATKPSASAKPTSILLATNVPQDSLPNPKLVGKSIWAPKRSTEGPVNFLLSGKDRSIYVYRNGVLIGQSPVGLRNPEEPIPDGVFLMLEGTDPNSVEVVPGRAARPWSTLALDGDTDANAFEKLRQRIHIPKDFGRKIYDLAKPGTILLTTQYGRSAKTQTKTDFTIMRPQEK